jgi:hypothetical protein
MRVVSVHKLGQKGARTAKPERPEKRSLALDQKTSQKHPFMAHIHWHLSEAFWFGTQSRGPCQSSHWSGGRQGLREVI